MKCTVCGQKAVIPDRPQSDVVRVIQWNVSEGVLEQNGPDPDEWQCCELCWTGLIYNWQDYVWDGESLLVWDSSKEEWIEYRGTKYRPVVGGQIQFEYDERSKTWQVMPR